MSAAAAMRIHFNNYYLMTDVSENLIEQLVSFSQRIIRHVGEYLQYMIVLIFFKR